MNSCRTSCPEELLTTVGDDNAVELATSDTPSSVSDDLEQASTNSKTPAEEKERKRPPDDGYTALTAARSNGR